MTDPRHQRRWQLVCVLLVLGCQSSHGSVAAPADGGPDATSPDTSSPENFFTRDQLLDPKACRACHPGQYDEWAGSMHAYAAADPVFLAMNRRGQEETDGALGDFCVGCHAPLALRDGLTTDGLNLEELPASYQGINCYFCHSVDRIEGDHNNLLGLSDDRLMRGSFADPVSNIAHGSAYSRLLDSTKPQGSALCGACHDVTLPDKLVGKEVALERTFAEWNTTLFSKAHAEGGLGCAGCHMPVSVERTTAATTEGAPKRQSKRHDFEAIDVALTPFPNTDRQRILTQRLLDTSLIGEICVSRVGVVEVTLENSGSGHSWPSGASQDREPWLDVRAYVAGTEEPIFATSEPALASDADAGAVAKPAPVLLKDFVVDENGEPAHMFWDVRRVDRSTTILGAATRDPLDPQFHRERSVFDFDTNSSKPIDRVTLRVRVRPIALGVLSDLVGSGHLDEGFLADMPVLDVLPDRCYDKDVLDRYQGLLGSAECDGDPDRDFTLVWHRDTAVAGNRRYREALVDQVPADCLSHPTYVPIAPTPSAGAAETSR